MYAVETPVFGLSLPARSVNQRQPYLVAAWASSQSVGRLYYGPDNLNLATASTGGLVNCNSGQRGGGASSLDDVGGESEDIVAILGTL
jgi:hypothetical protein